MGSKKIEVSELGRIASANIRSQLGVRRMSNRELARQIQRSESYVRARVNNEKEWTLNDIEAICRLWHMSPSTLVVPIPEITVPSAAELAATAAREQAKLEDARHHIASGMGMAALHDEHKYDPEPDNNA